MPQPDPPWIDRWIGPILVAYLVIVCLFLWNVPLLEATDEVSHVAYAQFLKENRRLPVQSLDPAKHETVVAHNPPLYYGLLAIATAWLDSSGLPRAAPYNPDFQWGDLNAGGPFVHQHSAAFDSAPGVGPALAVRIGRLLSAAAGALSVLLAYRIGRRLLATPAAAALGAALFAFLPSFLFTSATVHNDVAVTLFGLLALNQALVASRRPTPRTLALFGTFAALAGLSKLAGFLVTAAILPAAWRLLREGSWRSIGRLAWFAGPLAILTSPWLGWNLAQYGEPTGYAVFSQNPIFPLRPAPLTIAEAAAEMGPGSLLFNTLVLAYGYMDRLGPAWIYDAALWVAGLAAAGWVVAVLRARGVPGLARPEALAAAIPVALYVLFLARYVQGFASGGHGRYLFPVLPVATAAIAAGLTALLPARVMAPAGIAALAAGAALVGPFVIAPGYALAGRVAPATVGSAPAVAAFANGIELRSATVDEAADGAVTVTLTWAATRDVAENLQVLVQLVGGGGGVAGIDRAPHAGMANTARWRAGDTIRDVFTLRLPESAAPGRYEVRTGFYRRESLERIAVTQGEDRGGAAAIGAVARMPSPPPTPARVLDERFGGVFRLTGASALPGAARLGLDVALDLQKVAADPRDFVFSIQALLPNGLLLAQSDAQPLAGALPTSVWRLGAPVRESRRLVLPESQTAAPARLILVAYDAATGTRLEPAGGIALGSLLVGGP